MAQKLVVANAVLTATASRAARFSEHNVVNSITTYLAIKLLSARYLVYWHERGAVQTPDGWYNEWEANKATYLADPAFASQVASARGLISLVRALPAVPRFVQRLTSDASVGPADVVAVPTISVELGAALPVANYELGTTQKWRARQLILDAYVRNIDEQALVKDLFGLWFDAEQPLAIRDHDAGDLSDVGFLLVERPSIVAAVAAQGPEAVTYEVLLNAHLTYAA
jgi:hypothetical protein